MSQLIIEQYSERAIVVRGNSQPFKDELLNLGGKWNSMLKGGGGWIFPNSKKIKIEELKTKIEKGEVKPVFKQENKEEYDDKQKVNVKDYLNLLSRVERLEQILSNLNISKTQNNDTITINDSEDSENESEQKVERLLKKKINKK